MGFIDNIKRNEPNDAATLDALKCGGVPVILWGAGVIAERVYSYLCDKINLSGVLVDVETSVQEFHGLRIFNFQELNSEFGQLGCNIVVGHLQGYTMKNELKKRVKPIKNVYSINMALIYPDASGPCGPISYDYILQNENAFGWTYNEFSDELSRKSYLTYLNSKISSMFDDSVPMVNKCQYFCDDIIHLSAEESFIDCGAFNGDTVESFIIALKDRSIETYKSIYAFEPDADNFAKLNSLTQKYPNLYCINKGVYSEQTELRFKIGDMQSTIKNNGETSVAVDTIDNIIHEESGREISFIKMDIEGSELSALKGAEQTIRNYKPKLAICAYHKAEDLITIPQYIKSLVPEYNLFFRLHEPCTFEAVLYAVCD